MTNYEQAIELSPEHYYELPVTALWVGLWAFVGIKSGYPSGVYYFLMFVVPMAILLVRAIFMRLRIDGEELSVTVGPFWTRTVNATKLQHIGYYRRLSTDFILLRDDNQRVLIEITRFRDCGVWSRWILEAVAAGGANVDIDPRAKESLTMMSTGEGPWLA